MSFRVNSKSHRLNGPAFELIDENSVYFSEEKLPKAKRTVFAHGVTPFLPCEPLTAGEAAEWMKAGHEVQCLSNGDKTSIKQFAQLQPNELYGVLYDYHGYSVYPNYIKPTEEIEAENSYKQALINLCKIKNYSWKGMLKYTEDLIKEIK